MWIDINNLPVDRDFIINDLPAKIIVSASKKSIIFDPHFNQNISRPVGGVPIFPFMYANVFNITDVSYMAEEEEKFEQLTFY